MPPNSALTDERLELLGRINRGLETPMVVLGFVWLVLLVVELTAGLPPFLERAGYLIWGLFLVDFLIEFTLAPSKRSYLRRNWVTALALIAPAVRAVAALRLIRTFRAARGLRLFRVVSGLNRGMRVLGRIMGRRGLGYVFGLTGIVIFGGAAAVYAFEREAPGMGLSDFGSALWWAAMVITTMGTDYFPRSAEGRLLCLLLAIYGFAIFGYVTAAIASYFVVRDAESGTDATAVASQLERIRTEIAALRNDLAKGG